MCIGLVHIRLWFRCWGLGPWCDIPMLLPRGWFYCVGAIICRWVSRFVLWVGWTILFLFLLLMWVKYVCCVRVGVVGMKHKTIEIQLMQRMFECRVIFGSCGRKFLSPAMYKVCQLKESRYLGPCFEPWDIYPMRIMKLFISCGFPCGWISTYVVLSSKPIHSTGRGLLLCVLIAVGLSWLERRYSWILWWSVPCGQ